MIARFKIRYDDIDGKSQVRFTRTYSAVLIFIAAMKNKKLGKNFKVSTLKLRS